MRSPNPENAKKLSSTLPIDSSIPGIVTSLEKNPNLVLQASPGSGKTTRVPPALLRAGFCGEDREILVLEPRRLAAKWAARRVAEELGSRVGDLVGYQFRFENVSGPSTRLRFLTEGMLMRRMLSDRTLDRVAAVVLDEFHERHLHGDIALAYLRWLQKEKRPDLRILVMSATLDTEAVSRFLGECPVVQVEARIFPIETKYLPSPAAKPIEILVREAVSDSKGSGDVLVFLPGMAEIRRCTEALAPVSSSRDLLVIPLHGELSREEQDRAILPADRRKVILSTNIAETSLTIEGVTTVIDSGLHRIASYSWWSGVPALRTRPVSRASAVQRAGRAGRTAPGQCLRLYSKGEFDSRPPFETPEIQRADLAQTILELKSLGVKDPFRFGWFQSPSPQSVESAQALLFRLGALEDSSASSALTELGRRMIQIPAHPRIARILLEAEKRGVLDGAATLAALISEGRLENLDASEQLERPPYDEGFKKAKRHLLNAFGQVSRTKSDSDAVAFSLLTGFPDRVARKRALPSRTSRGRANEVELVFSSGGSARIEETGVIAHADTFVTLDIQERQFRDQARSELKLRSICAIRPEWLFDLSPIGVEEKKDLLWDSEKNRLVRVQQLAYDELILDETRAPLPAPEADEGAARALLQFGLRVDSAIAPSMSARDWLAALGKITDPDGIEAAFARLSFFSKHRPELPVPDPSVNPPWNYLAPLFLGKTSLAELREFDWPQEILASAVPEHLSQLERDVPAFVLLARGRRTRVHYKLDQPPWIESRLQDFFGMKTGPSLLGGRVPLTLHLLAPNQRAVQVTSDLTGFWSRNYPSLRKELGRRYPRHAWPEDPLASV